jgi:DNA-binding winged helix-turn-helix (wHTH) protein/tetratricopeptide (TPR) repeat protein
MDATRFRLGRREIDLLRRTVATDGGGEVILTPNEVRLLGLLLANAGATVDREQLQLEGLQYRKELNTRAVDQAIWRIRKKLEDDVASPRYLQSDPPHGYRLVLDDDQPRALLGRAEALARLRALVAGKPSEVWVCGLPGVGRKALVAALGDVGATRIRASTAMPEDHGIPTLRLGPLAPEHGEALLCRVLLDTRGSTALDDEERAHVPRLAAAVDHHPASLVALGRQAAVVSLARVTAGVSSGGPTTGVLGADPALVALLERTPEPLRARLRRWLLFPDAFDIDDVGAMGDTPDDLERLWRVGLCEGEAGRFRILAPLRSAAAWLGDAEPQAVACFVGRVRAQVAAPTADWYATGSDEGGDRLASLRPRIVAALRLAPDDEDLLTAWLTVRVGPAPFDTTCTTGPPWARVAAAIVRSEALAKQNLDAALFEIGAVQDQPVSARLALLRFRVQFGLLLARAAPPEALEAAVRGARLDRDPGSFARATLLQARGILANRRGQREESTAAALEAMSILREGGAHRLSLQSLANLAMWAFREGRATEALAWIDGSLGSPKPAVESSRRQLRALMLVGCGRFDEAGAEMVRAEALAGAPVLATPTVLVDLLEGRLDQALVGAQTALALRPPPSHDRTLRYVLVWARLLQGNSADAERILEQLRERHPPKDAWGIETYAFTRAVAAAREGRPDVAREALRACAAEGRRWSILHRIGLTFVETAEGWPVELASLRGEIARSNLTDVLVQLGVRLL